MLVSLSKRGIKALYLNKVTIIIEMIKNLHNLRHFCQYKAFLHSLPYPFNFTYSLEEFQFEDRRFAEHPIMNKLYPQQLNHLQFVLKKFFSILNRQQNKEKQALEFIDQRLLEKINDFQLIQDELQFKSAFSLNLESIKTTNGFLEVYGLNEQLGFIHEYTFHRQNNKLTAQKKKIVKEKSEEEKIQQLSQKIKGTNKVKEDVGNHLKKSTFNYFNKAFDFITRKSKTKTPGYINQHILVERIDGTFNMQFQAENISESKQLTMTTKWLYHVNQNQPADIKKSRKRILFDFQFWNRGSFVPIKQFV